MPTRTELATLTDAEKVSGEWVAATETTPVGRKFTDIATGNSIFFRATGLRHPDNGSTMVNIGTLGLY